MNLKLIINLSQNTRTMATFKKNPDKHYFRQRIEQKILKLSANEKKQQSNTITQKIITSELFKNAKNISMYLSTDNEVNTIDILIESFMKKKNCFIPTYENDVMKMVQINDLDDYNKLPLTKWKIKQPDFNENRLNAMETENGLDLFLIPGVGFTLSGERLGHGRGYYDRFLLEYFKKYSNTKLIGLAFREQIIGEGELPLDPHDYPLDMVVTSD